MSGKSTTGLFIMAILGGIADLFDRLREKLGIGPIICPMCHWEKEFYQCTKTDRGWVEFTKRCDNCKGRGRISWFDQHFSDAHTVAPVQLPKVFQTEVPELSIQEFLRQHPEDAENAVGLFWHRDSYMMPTLYAIFKEGYKPK